MKKKVVRKKTKTFVRDIESEADREYGRIEKHDKPVYQKTGFGKYRVVK